MRLVDLIGDNNRIGNRSMVEIRGLTEDSRKVEPGYLFAAFPGAQTDGARFIGDAIARGAAAVLAAPGILVSATAADGGEVELLTAANPRRVFATLAARFHAPQPDIMAAVTGTNGKTSVASFTRQIWQHLGHSAGSVGTLGVIAEGFEKITSLTTPDSVTLHRALQELHARGVDHVACEASSHGLAQYRLDGLSLKAAAFTNLSRDHLDYHQTEEEYFFCKARLFGQLLPPGGAAVINMGDAYASDLEGLCWARGHRLIRVGQVEGEIRLLSRIPEDGGQALTVACEDLVVDVTLPLVGEFQAMNALVAAGLVIGCGGDPRRTLEALAHLRSVPGRMELVSRLANGASVYVDYAHTPDALATVLAALRPHVRGELGVVFGCGGDRDRGKRPIMGAIATAEADRVYVTDDNPRGEDAGVIRREILAAAPGATEIGDRRRAIETAMAALGAGDILIVAGKGHERGQTIRGEVRDFSDLAEVRAAASRIERGELSAGGLS